jgi:hypothetical protein
MVWIDRELWQEAIDFKFWEILLVYTSMELLCPTTVRFKLLERPNLEQIEHREYMRAEQIEAPEEATVATDRAALILVHPDYHLHLLLECPSAHLAHAEHPEAGFIAHLSQFEVS